MDYKPLKTGNLTAKVPVIQGGMGIGISLGNLAGTVAKVGGIGVISAAQIGFKEADFDQNPEKANLRTIQKEYEKARKIAPDGVIGFNIMVAMRHYEKYVEAAIQAGWCRRNHQRSRTSDGSAENSRSKSGETCADRFVRKIRTCDFQILGEKI